MSKCRWQQQRWQKQQQRQRQQQRRNTSWAVCTLFYFQFYFITTNVYFRSIQRITRRNGDCSNSTSTITKGLRRDTSRAACMYFFYIMVMAATTAGVRDATPLDLGERLVFFLSFFFTTLMFILDLSTYESWLRINKGSRPILTDSWRQV